MTNFLYLHGNKGVLGLQRALKIAGVKQMIISLWRVPDKQTVELMTLFYKNWLNGESIRDALRSSQLKMKEKGIILKNIRLTIGRHLCWWSKV